MQLDAQGNSKVQLCCPACVSSTVSEGNCSYVGRRVEDIFARLRDLDCYSATVESGMLAESRREWSTLPASVGGCLGRYRG